METNNMLRQLTSAEVEQYIQDDTVRPHLSTEFRTTQGRQVWGLFEDKYALYDDPSEKPQAIICVAYTNEAPTCERELEWYSTASGTGAVTTNTAVFYTVWSYGQGAGRELVNTLAAHILNTRSEIQRWVTLSPLTDMAARFHTKNGAQLRSVHDTCQVFEYTHLLESTTA
tara:strand:+ start:431 stop:943 length:513 start_codon:yes stop_codon:yes gene_type:complete